MSILGLMSAETGSPSANAAGPLDQSGDDSVAVMSSPLVPINGIAVGGESVVQLALNQAGLQAMLNKRSVVLTDFVLAPLATGGPPVVVTVDLEPIDVYGPETRFIVAEVMGPDEPLTLPLPDVQMFGGVVRGIPDSNVFLSFSSGAINGFVRVNQRTQVISSGPWGEGESAVIFDPDLLPQGVIRWRDFVCESVSPGGEAPVMAAMGGGSQVCVEILMAIETDYEFSANLFGGNLTNSSAYVTTLLGAVSQIYTNAVNAHFKLGQVRVWSSNTDPWNAVSTGSQLTQFRNYYNANMSAVPRQLAHFLSGRGLGGGVAYLSVVCNSSYGYGVSANLSGHFPNPIVNNNSQNWDLNVTAHEIGHNCGAIHTHDYCPPVDQCASPSYWGQCQTATVCSNAGTLMSYCHTCAGGLSNILMQFHPASINSIGTHLGSLTCNVSCTSAPVVTILSPSNGATAAFGTSVTFTGTAIDPDHGNLTSSLVWLSNIQGQIGTGGTFSRSDLQAGTHTITARCTDPGGQVGTASMTLTISPPINTPPVVSISSPSNNASFIWGTSITFSGSANDTQSGNLSASLVWLSGVQGQIGTGATVSTSNLVVGTHTITARCTDAGNLTGTASITITITPSPINSPPTVIITSPANGSSSVFGTQVNFSGSASDTQDGNVTSLIVWTSSIQGQLGVGGLVLRSDLAIGNHAITARVIDSGLLQGAASITITVTAAPPAVDKHAQSDIPVAGVVTGTYVRTQSNNGVYQSIKEIKSNGTQFTRYSYLDHRWSISLPTTAGTRTFHIKAYHSVSTDGDDMAFDYSTNGTSFTPMLTVIKTADNGTYQTFTLPAFLSGKIYIRAQDTDRTPGNKFQDTLFVDDMFVRVQ